MNLRALLLIFLWGGCLSFFAQERDTTYIQPYPQEIWLRAYTPTKMLILTQGKEVYSPNYPFSLGVGIGLRKILGLNVLYAQNLFRLKNETNLKTRSIDIQAHKYGKRILIDAYYQDYTGFYIDRGKGNCHVLKKVVIINYYFISQFFSLSYLLKVHLIRSF